MKLHVIDNGIERVDKLFLIAGHGAATLRQPQPPHDWVDIPIQTFLVEHDGRRILFDTAVDLNWRESWPDRIKDTSPYIHTPEQYLPAALGRLGLAPEDIDTVVMSHLHADHAGCLHMFRNAAVYVSDRELTRTLRQYALREDMGIHIPADIAACLAAELRWRPVLDDEDELEVAPGVRILNFGPGHSWGLLGLWVSLPASGDFILVSDAIYMEECVRDGIFPPPISTTPSAGSGRCGASGAWPRRTAPPSSMATISSNSAGWSAMGRTNNGITWRRVYPSIATKRG